MVGEIRIGISGWRYAPWRGDFYPRGLPQRAELAYAAERMTAIEVNGSFYALQRPASYQRWRSEVPDGFRFSVKGPRFITHMKKLADARTPLANFFASGVLALGPVLGPVLWQLPPTLGYDADRLRAFAAELPRSTGAAAALARQHDQRLDGEGRAWTASEDDRPIQHVLEVRHDTFRTPEFPELLRELGVGLVVADTAGRWPYFEHVTADLVYVRLHGDSELYVSGYDDPALDRWAAKVLDWADRGLDVWVFFDNDTKVRAPKDAMALIERVRAART
jgi:uncharacterized protein YecE (DUF72 family)